MFFLLIRALAWLFGFLVTYIGLKILLAMLGKSDSVGCAVVRGIVGFIIIAISHVI